MMAGLSKKIVLEHQPNSDDELPEEIIQALDASASDLENGRIVDLDESLREMEAELEAHLARRRAAPR